jgi:BCD family chlorophyll transporter-like MFS transporter
MHRAVRIFNNIRLTLFPMAYALSGVLIGSTLNRIMIADLGYSTTLVALVFAIPLMVSPVRIWIGYRSDGFPIFGKRREPYIIAGAFVIGLGVVAITNLITSGTSAAMMLGVALAFLLYGLGRNISHNTFQALVADRYSGETRSRAATLYEVATMVGMVMGAGLIKSMLKVYDPGALISTASIIALVILVMAFLASIGQEPKVEENRVAAEKSREVKFSDAFREVVMSDPQVRLFFIIVVMTFVGTLAQDVFLEPFGGLVLNMEVGETTGLTQYWGIGVLLAMLVSGIFLLKWLGHMRVMRMGMVLSALAFAGPIVAGAVLNVALFKASVFVLGIGTGLAGAGLLSGTMTFTTRVRAGMLLGVWGVANMTGHAIGSLMGGVIVDTMRALTGSAFIAYATLFGLEMVILFSALMLTFRLDLKASKAYQEERMAIPVEAAAE